MGSRGSDAPPALRPVFPRVDILVDRMGRVCGSGLDHLASGVSLPCVGIQVIESGGAIWCINAPHMGSVLGGLSLLASSRVRTSAAETLVKEPSRGGRQHQRTALASSPLARPAASENNAAVAAMRDQALFPVVSAGRHTPSSFRPIHRLVHWTHACYIAGMLITGRRSSTRHDLASVYCSPTPSNFSVPSFPYERACRAPSLSVGTDRVPAALKRSPAELSWKRPVPGETCAS